MNSYTHITFSIKIEVAINQVLWTNCSIFYQRAYRCIEFRKVNIRSTINDTQVNTVEIEYSFFSTNWLLRSIFYVVNRTSLRINEFSPLIINHTRNTTVFIYIETTFADCLNVRNVINGVDNNKSICKLYGTFEEFTSIFQEIESIFVYFSTSNQFTVFSRSKTYKAFNHVHISSSSYSSTVSHSRALFNLARVIISRLGSVSAPALL